MPFIHRLHPELIHFTDTLAIRWYGLSYLMGFIGGYLILKRFLQRNWLHVTLPVLQDILTSFCIFGVMIGGRLGYFVFYTPEVLLKDPLQLVRIWEGGMSSHGGILGGIAVLLFYAKKTKTPFLHLTDNFAVVAPLGIGFGRLANFINGELWGRHTELPWGVVFPLEHPKFSPGGSLAHARYDLSVLQDFVQRGLLQPRHPSQLYQAVAEGFLLFGVLMLLRRLKWSRAINGRLSAVFLFGYALARFVVEFVREPDARLYFGWMTTGQFLTLFLFALSISLWKFIERGAKV